MENLTQFDFTLHELRVLALALAHYWSDPAAVTGRDRATAVRLFEAVKDAQRAARAAREC
jgi:hypothetical protein